MAIRFKEEDVRPMGRTAKGVKGISLDEDDYLVGMEIATADAQLLVVTEKGYGKRTPLSEYRVQTRGGKGVITLRTTKKNGLLIGAKVVKDQEEVMIISKEGIIIRLEVNDISSMGKINPRDSTNASR